MAIDSNSSMRENGVCMMKDLENVQCERSRADYVQGPVHMRGDCIDDLLGRLEFDSFGLALFSIGDSGCRNLSV